METEYPTLRRPKRKLCYLTNKENQYKEWLAPLTMEDVDNMFDDMDSSSHDDLRTPSPLRQTFDTETNENDREASAILQEGYAVEEVVECEMGPEEVLHPATRSSIPKLNTDCHIPFKAHGPVKTSSPTEQNVGAKGVEEKQNDEKHEVVSAILFPCEDEGEEEAKTEHSPIKKPQCNGHATDENDGTELESPPSKVTFSKTSSKKNAETLCKEHHVAKDKIPTEPQTPVLKGRRKLQSRQENTEPAVQAVGQESEVAALEKNPETVHKQSVMEVSTRAGKDMSAFLQKVKDAGQSKSICSRKSPVKAPTPPPEPEDDFLIMDDDAPLWVAIPRKNATSKRHGHSRTSSTEKDSSADKGKKDSSPETLQRLQESEKANGKLESQTVNQRKKKKMEKEKNNKETEPEKDEGELPCPQDLPAADLMEQEQPKKKKWLKKFSSEESDKAVDQPKDRAKMEMEKEKPSQKVKTKQKSSEMKKTKSSEDVKQNIKTSKAKSLKGTRKELQGSDDANEMVQVDVEEQSLEQSGKEHVDTEDLGSSIDKEVMTSDPDGKSKQNKQPVESAGSSSEDSPVLGKRKRRQTGEWWLCSPQITDEPENQQPTLKKTKQRNKEPSAAVASPVKVKKVYKKINQTQPAPLSSPNMNKAKRKKIKQTKKRNARGDTPGKKTTDEVFSTTEAEQMEEQEQQEAPDQDLDQEPLFFAHRDLSRNSGVQLFQRVYHHTSNKKLSVTPAVPVSPRQPKEQLQEAKQSKRQRKPPGSWWMVDDAAEDLESVSSQPEQLHPKQPKPRKEREKLSKQSKSPGLGVPKNGNTAASPKPLGGAPVPPLTVTPLSAPKNVRRSLATLKDIFTSVTETPTGVSNRNAHRNNQRNVRSHPAREVSATDDMPHRNTDTDLLDIVAGECRRTQSSHHNDENPQNREGQPDNTTKLLRSGPSSMIELEEYEENDDMTSAAQPPSKEQAPISFTAKGKISPDMALPSSRVQAVLSVSDLCASPLRPLVLQRKDKANLTEWFKSLWSTIADSRTEITPDQFDWYFYQGRVIGFQVDLNSRSICNGKILLGSHAKKPLWVDHSSTTVFNLLTSSVNVTIDGSESHISPGQSFMVECGHAYSIHNATAQPAVLTFTRILAESSY